MSRHPIRLSSTAKRDIAQALEWTLAKFGSRQHDRYRDMIEGTLRLIAAEPATPLSKSRPELHRDARTIFIARDRRRGRHFLVYRVGTDGVVEVARLLHEAMELSRHLPPGFGTED